MIPEAPPEPSTPTTPRAPSLELPAPPVPTGAPRRGNTGNAAKYGPLARFTLGLRTHGTGEARLFRLKSEFRLQRESKPR